MPLNQNPLLLLLLLLSNIPKPPTMSNHLGQDVYMTRHSARADREEHSWKPLPGRKRDDTELSRGGEVASNELHQKFESIPIAHIVSSPFYRCLQTVAPVAIAKGLKIKVEPGICEVLNTYPPGFWDNQRLASETDLPIDMDYEPELPREELKREWGDLDASDRSRQVATSLRSRLDGPILFCGHGASCLGIAEAFGGSGYVGYSSFSHFRQQGQRWRVVAMGDVSHLSDKLREQSLGSAW